MQVIDLNGYTSDWKVRGHLVSSQTKRQARSSLHLQARQLLHEVFPTMQIYEEVPLKLYNSLTVYFDFVVPLRCTVIEVQGEQHFKFVPHFHSTRHHFIHQCHRDREKVEWCNLNDFNLIVLPYNEDIDVWRTKIC